MERIRIMTGHQEVDDTESYNKDSYFRTPIIPRSIHKATTIKLPQHFHHEVLDKVVHEAQGTCYIVAPKAKPYQNAQTQTDYRESETQTLPWEPPCKYADTRSEILALSHLTWGHGLPAGVHEVEIINRMRMTRAWESMLPPTDSPTNTKMRVVIIAALDVEEWAFRELEIQHLLDMRLQLMMKASNIKECEQNKKLKDRFGRLKCRLEMHRAKRVTEIQSNLKRELRKLRKKHNLTQNLGKTDVIKRHMNQARSIRSPQMQFGEHSRMHQEKLQKQLLNDRYIDKIQIKSSVTELLMKYKELRGIKPKPKPPDLCIRATRWTEEKLAQMHVDLKAIRLNLKPIETPFLMIQKYKPLPFPLTPLAKCTWNKTEELINKSCTFIQKTVRGRAIQCMMFDGRNRCRELIEELQSTHALDEHDKAIQQREQEYMINLQRKQNEKFTQDENLQEIYNSLEGMTVSSMLDYLSKELIRLEDERRIHAFALLAERERSKIEAYEAGRRQNEYRRRREFDEMFRQLVKINQESVECYLENIIKEGIEWTSDQHAREYIVQLADKIDEIVNYESHIDQDIREEELVADMIYNFVLPEVEKTKTRRLIKEKQQSYLQNAHAMIYDTIKELPVVQIVKNPSMHDAITLCDESDFYEAEHVPEDSSEINTKILNAHMEEMKLSCETENAEAVDDLWPDALPFSPMQEHSCAP